jgi:phosphate transport system protein
MRTHFGERLQSIHSRVIAMGTHATDMIKQGAEAIIHSDISLAGEVIRKDDFIDQAERDLLFETIRLVMQETPVASDLRFLVSTLGVIGEIEKVADDAVLKVLLSTVSEQSRSQFVHALKLYSEYSKELAESIIAQEEVVDTGYSEARHKVYEMMKANPDNPAKYVRIIEVFHALEHISDHAASIATRMQLVYEPAEQQITLQESIAPAEAESQPE